MRCVLLSLPAVIARVLLSPALAPASVLMGPAHLGFPLFPVVVSAFAQRACARHSVRHRAGPDRTVAMPRFTQAGLS